MSQKLQVISDNFHRHNGYASKTQLILRFADGTQQEPVDVYLTDFELEFKSDVEPVHYGSRSVHYVKGPTRFTLKGAVVEKPEPVAHLEPYVSPVDTSDLTSEETGEGWDFKQAETDYWDAKASESRRMALEADDLA